MAQLSPADYVQKWTLKFADNTIQNFTEALFREFMQDTADSFNAAAAAVNVPTYDPAAAYTVGFLVRYSQAGGRESFYYALKAGPLPHPSYNQSDSNWKLVPGPVAETVLSQHITLAEAGGIEGAGVAEARLYLIRGLPAQGQANTWNQDGTDRTLAVRGFENYFARTGTLFDADGVPVQEVSVNVGAGTYQALGAGYSDAQARAAQLGRTAPPATLSVTLTAESPVDYGTASNGATFSVSAAGCQVGQCAFFNVAANGGPPSFVNDSPAQPYDLALGTHVPGQLNRYAVRVFADRVEVTNVVR